MFYVDRLRQISSKPEKRRFLESVPWNLKVTAGSGGQIKIYNSTLGVSGSGAGMDEAYRELQKRQIQIFEDALEAGCEDELRFPGDVDGQQPFLRQYKLSVLKHLTIAAIYLVTFFVGAQFFGRALAKGGKKVVHEWTQLTEGDAAREKRGIERFRGQMESLKPYIREIKKTWSETN